MEDRKLKILFLNIAPTMAHVDDMSELFESGFMGPLAETGQADYEMLWVGPWMDTSAAPMDWAVFRRCTEYRPDVLFIHGWSLGRDDAEKANYPALFTFYLIRQLLNIKVVGLLFDQAFEQFKVSDNLVRLCDFVFCLEPPELFRRYTAYPEKHVVTPVTYSPRLYHGDPNAERNIGVAFVGGVGGRYPKERQIGLDALKKNGVAVFNPGGRSPSQKRLSTEDYADIFKRSKIIINWSRHISGKYYQMKGRIFESTLSGAMLLCEECAGVNQWFRPNHDYVPFSTTEELVQKAEYYLQHENERLKIAAQGNETAMARYRADAVWDQMLQAMNKKRFYNENDATSGIRLNASPFELRIARFFKQEIPVRFPDLDQRRLDDAVGIVQRANGSLLQRFSWHSWFLKSARWKLRRQMARRWRNLGLRIQIFLQPSRRT